MGFPKPLRTWNFTLTVKKGTGSEEFFKDHLGCHGRNDLKRGRNGDMEQIRKLFCGPSERQRRPR